MKNKPRIIAISAWVALAAYFLYLLPDPRMADGALTFGEATLFDLVVIFSIVAAMLGLWFFGLAQLASSGKWGLFCLALLFWPIAHV